MNVIMVSGLKRSGKDFISGLLKTELEKEGHNVEVYAFADPIKEILCETLDMTLVEFNTYKNELTPVIINGKSYTNMRRVIQDFGESMKDKFGNDIWAKAMVKRINSSSADVIITSDFRFLIEYEYLKSVGYNITTLQVLNYDIGYDDAHPSERELIKNDFHSDFHINNTSYNDNVYKNVKYLVTEYFNKIVKGQAAIAD